MHTLVINKSRNNKQFLITFFLDKELLAIHVKRARFLRSQLILFSNVRKFQQLRNVQPLFFFRLWSLFPVFFNRGFLVMPTVIVKA